MFALHHKCGFHKQQSACKERVGFRVEGIEVVCKFKITHYKSRSFPIRDFTFFIKLTFAAVLCPHVEVGGLFKDQKS